MNGQIVFVFDRNRIFGLKKTGFFEICKLGKQSRALGSDRDMPSGADPCRYRVFGLNIKDMEVEVSMFL